jgi:hypothetical protein
MDKLLGWVCKVTGRDLGPGDRLAMDGPDMPLERGECETTQSPEIQFRVTLSSGERKGSSLFTIVGEQIL